MSFELAGQPFMAISAGSLFKFNPSVSFHIKCGTKEEASAVWERLSPGVAWYAESWQVIYTVGSSVRHKFTPIFMFVDNVCGKAEEAIDFYVSVFANARNREVRGDQSGRPLLLQQGRGAGQGRTVRYVHFSLPGQEFGAMDSARGQKFAFNEAMSFIVPCNAQEEIDYFLEKLSADAEAEQCGWLKDKYGPSWQITPGIR